MFHIVTSTYFQETRTEGEDKQDFDRSLEIFLNMNQEIAIENEHCYLIS